MRRRGSRKGKSERMRELALRRWELDRARRDEEEPRRIQELAAHPLIKEGDAIGSLEFRDLRSGMVKRWVVLQGDRADRVKLRTPDGRTSGSHGWTRMLESLRGVFAGRKV